MQLIRLPRSMVVVGGGIIGIEYASMFASLGVKVTLIDKRSRVLEFLDWEIVDELIHQMRDWNVTFRLGELVQHMEIADTNATSNTIPRVGKLITSDLVLFSAGRFGATERLKLDAAGLTADDRGRLKVDAQFPTE